MKNNFYEKSIIATATITNKPENQDCKGEVEYNDFNALFIADGATAHKAELFDKEKLVFERLPAACPELNPVERFFKEVRKQLKNRVFETLEQAQKRIQKIVEDLFEEQDKVIALTCFPYLTNTT